MSDETKPEKKSKSPSKFVAMRLMNVEPLTDAKEMYEVVLKGSSIKSMRKAIEAKKISGLVRMFTDRGGVLGEEISGFVTKLVK